MVFIRYGEEDHGIGLDKIRLATVVRRVTSHWCRHEHTGVVTLRRGAASGGSKALRLWSYRVVEAQSQRW